MNELMNDHVHRDLDMLSIYMYMYMYMYTVYSCIFNI